MDSVAVGNKRKWSGEEEFDLEEKKLRLRSDSDTDHPVNATLQTSIVHKTEITFVHQVSEIHSTDREHDTKNDVQQDPETSDSLSGSFSAEVFGESEIFVADSIRLEKTSLSLELFNSGSETTVLTKLPEIKDEAGNLIEDSKKFNISKEDSSTINSECETTISEPENIQNLREYLSKESCQVYDQNEDSSPIYSKTETISSPPEKDDEGWTVPFEASQVNQRDEGSMTSGIISKSESSLNYDIHIETEQDENRHDSTLIVEEVSIKELSPASSSESQTETSDDVSSSLQENEVDSEDKDDSEDEDDSEKYLYRLLRPGEPYMSGISPKDKYSSTSLEDHVNSGSSSGMASKYISCSKTLDKVKLFAGMIRKGWRHELRHIVRIDRSLIGDDVEEIDLTDTTIRETHLTSDRSRRNSLRFHEMILVPKDCIPAASIKRIGQVQNGSISIDE